MRTSHLYFIQRWTFCFLGCLLDAAQLLWIVLVELVPKLLCPSWKSLKILAAQRPVIRNPTVAHFLQYFFALLSPPFFGLLLGCSSTFQCGNEHLSPNLQPDSDLSNWHSGGCHQSQGNSVQVPSKKFLLFWTSRTAFCLWRSFSSNRFYLVSLMAQRVERFLLSVSHDRDSRAGNRIGLLSRTDLFLSTGNIFLFLFQYHLIPCDS